MPNAATIEGLEKAPVTLAAGNGRAESWLHRLKIAGKPFYLLRQRGKFQDIAFDHGRLLAREMDGGAFPEIIATIARGIDLEDDLQHRFAAALYQHYSDSILNNVSDEFREALEALADGYLGASGNPSFTREQVLYASIAIEVGNLAEGLARMLEIPGIQLSAVADLLLSVPGLFDDGVRGYIRRIGDDTGAQRSMQSALRRMTGPNARIDFACTGFSIPGSATDDGRHLHARNLDADLYEWNNAPMLHLIDETPANAGWHKYVAFGTAGMIYPGGISGVNDAGLAVSLHQMSTTRYDSGFLNARGEIAPFLQQRILREAATLGDAADIAAATRNFAAWTVFCSDAKTGKAMRIEINGDKTRVDIHPAAPVPQTNHFLSKDMVERHFDQRDEHYTPTLGKWLETHARYASVDNALATATHGSLGVDWAIDQLSSSRDWYIDGIAKAAGATDPVAGYRSYGRVPRKVYGQMTSIVCPDPGRRAGHDQVWVTTGDRQPAPHGTYCGWKVDWNAFSLAPVANRPLRRTNQYVKAGLSHWEQSLERYLWSRLAVARPRGAGGELLRRRQTYLERLQSLQRGAALLDSAIQLAAADRIVEGPYHYMRARLRNEIADNAGARADWSLLRAIWAKQKGRHPVACEWPVDPPRVMPVLHDYEAALVLILSTVTEDRLQHSITWAERKERIKEAKTLLKRLGSELFVDCDRPHFDLNNWLTLADQLEDQHGATLDLPEPYFVTVE